MNRKKLWKKTVILTIAAGMTAGVFSGCATKEEENKPQAKGRYIERKITLTEECSTPLGIIYQENKLVLYTSSADAPHYQSYVYEAEKWSAPREEVWMTDAKDRLNQYVADVFLGKDGNLYGKAKSPEGIRLLKAGDGTAEDVTPQAVSQNDASVIIDAAVLKDGTIGIGNYAESRVEFYKDGNLVFSTEGIFPSEEEQTMLEVSDTTVAVVGKDGASIDFYDITDFEKKNTVKLEQDFDTSFLVSGTDGIWYYVNEKGIHRITEDGSISELIMDGGNGMMSNSETWFLRRFISGGENEFYGLYSNINQEWKLMQYVFDRDVAAVQEKTLSVYSLKENDTVAQAVYEFKRKHPEVKIEYVTSVTGNEEPTADHIRTLNTELLSGSGADVLILDGLPMESYMEKGVLLDLSDVAEELKKTGVLENVIAHTVRKDDKIYGLPARVNVPVIYGTEEEIKACDSISSLEIYAQSNPDKKLFGATSHDLIGMTLFHMFYDELQEENGGLKEERLAELISAWMQICDNGNFKELEEKYFVEEESIWHILDSCFCSSRDVFSENTYVCVGEIAGLGAAKTDYTSARKTGNLPQNYKGYYVPKTIAGVNASAKQTKLAKEFVECLFAEDVQRTDSGDGFPVLSSVLESYPEYVESEESQKAIWGYYGTDFETGEQYKVTLSYPTKKETEELIAVIKNLNTPFIEDRIVSETVQQELEKCYKGKQSPEETAKTICQKIDMYLSE